MTSTIKITELANAGVLSGTEEVPIVAGSTTKRTTTQAIANLAVVSAPSLTVGTTVINSGTTTRVLYDNAGVLGEYAISGTGSVAMTNSPTLVTPALGVPTSLTLTNATGLPVGGISATGTPSASTFLRGDGSWQSVSVSPAGSTTQVQFNNAGAFGASANLTWSSPALTIGVASTTRGQMVLANTTANSVTVQSSNSTSAAWTLTLPVDAGTNGYALTTNGSGVASWSAISASPGGSTTQVQYNNAGSFAGAAGFTFNGTAGLTLGVAATSTGSLTLANATSGSAILTTDAANTLALRNSTSAQIFNVYNTYTDGSNYERGVVGWSSNELLIATEYAGTGSARNIRMLAGNPVSQASIVIQTSGGVPTILGQWNSGTRSTLQLGGAGGNDIVLTPGSTGHVIFGSDNVYDFGASGSVRPRTGYFGTSVVTPLATITQGTITADAPQINGSATWNNSGVTFTGWKLNVTDTASASASLLMDLQVGGTSKFNVAKSGNLAVRQLDAIDSTNGIRLYGGATYLWGSNQNTQLGILNGAVAVAANTAIQWYSGNASGASLSGSADVILARDAANTLALRNGTNAQTFRVYGTYTDGSNYERAYLSKGAGPGGLTTLGTEKAGTGSAGNIAIIADGTSIFHCGSFGSGFMSMYTNITGASAGVYDLGAGSIGGAFRRLHLTEFIETIEMTAPSAPSANGVRIYATDNGSGKTVLYALFASGSAQQLAIEP